MKPVSIEDVQRDLTHYLELVRTGESLILISEGRAVAEIKPVATNSREGSNRPFGLASGDFVVPDDFDAPLPERVLRSFESL